MPCRHHDIQVFDGLRCCLACGETIFESDHSQDSGLPKASYTYAHLNYSLSQEIRLCALFPGSPNDDIWVDLVHTNVTDNHPPYEAISYAWATQDGDDSLSQTVRCYGGTISVTKTCEAALRRLRLTGRKRYLWVDAVCIDQTNVKERNHQVGFMGTIFANASQVVIYLGAGSGATDVVLDYLNGNKDAFTNVRDHAGGIIRDFLNYRWFDRVWVLQEIALARLATMVAGEKTARWTLESITKLLALCTKMPIEPPSVLRWLPASQPEPDILSVLQKSRNCSSTDPRDKVFAVLGLARADFQQGFPIDYTLTVEQVYTQLATHLILVEGDLRILKYATGQSIGSDQRDIPSWVPQWDVKVRSDPLPPQFNAEEMANFATIWSTQSPQSDQSAADTPDELLQTFLAQLYHNQQPLPTATWLRRFSLWLEETAPTRALPTCYPPSDLEAAAITLTRIHAQDFHFTIVESEANPDLRFPGLFQITRQPWPALRVRAHALDTIMHIIGPRSASRIHHFPTILPLASRLCTPCSKHYISAPVCQHTPSITHTLLEECTRETTRILADKTMTMFQTRRSFGLAALGEMRVGDGIWVLDGVDSPVVLMSSGGRYELVGECFLWRAGRGSLCVCCGCKVEEWPMVTQIIELW